MRLEHELVVLRQKVLMALKHATSLQAHNLANQELEAELVKVQVSLLAVLPKLFIRVSCASFLVVSLTVTNLTECFRLMSELAQIRVIKNDSDFAN